MKQLQQTENPEWHFSVCSCESPDHTLQWGYDPGTEDWPVEELYCYVNLSWNQKWYKRIWNAIKYIFGYRSKYGHFDCFLLTKEEAQKLVDFLKQRKYIK